MVHGQFDEIYDPSSHVNLNDAVIEEFSQVDGIRNEYSNVPQFLATNRRAPQHRRPVSSKLERKAQQKLDIGGDVVKSMKRGLKLRPEQDTRRAILLFIALILFVALTTTWIYRLDRRVQTIGGWSTLVFALVREDNAVPEVVNHVKPEL